MKDIYQKIEKICGNKYFILLFLPISILFLLLYSYTTSPLYIHEGMDSAVFKTMGLAILKGKIPYVDIFDHKGPILYFINAFGQWLIPGRLGIFILQVIGLFTTLIFLFKIANLFTGRFISFLSILLTLFVYGGFIQEGNQCEEWMLPFFTLALYIALRYLLKEYNSPHKWYYGFIYGLCFGITFYIRPNDAVAFIGGIVIGLLYWIIYKQNFRNLFDIFVSFLFGFGIIILPISIYFVYNNAMSEMLYGLIGFNSEYSGGLLTMIMSMLGHQKLILLLFLIVILIMSYIIKSRIIYVISFISLLQLLLLGPRCYAHYYIVLIPIFLVYIVLVLNIKDKIYQLIFISIFCLSPVCNERQIIKNSRKEMYKRFEMIKNNAIMEEFYNETNLLLSHIDKSTIDDVWNFNLSWRETPNFSCLIHNNIVQSNIITFASSDKLLIKDNIYQKKPQWVVVENYNGIQRDNIFTSDSLLISLYEFVDITDTTICNIELYHLKN